MLQSDQSKNKLLQTESFEVSSVKVFISELKLRLEKIVDNLQHEQKLLINGDADQVSNAAQEKLKFMQELSAFIENYFRKEANNPNNERLNIENILQSINEICSKLNIEEWNNIKTLIKLCHELTDENSVLLANRLKYTNNAIDTLFSLAGASQNKTYDNTGLSQNDRLSRQLASV